MTNISLKKAYVKYPQYKDSGVEWLGEIPEAWEAKKLQRLFTRVKRAGYINEELLSVYRDHGVIPKSSREDNFNKESDDLSAYQLVDIGDLAINKMKAWQGSLAISGYRGIVSPAYYIAKPILNNHGRFLHYLLRSDVYIQQYQINSGGVRNDQWDLDYERFRKIEAILPPNEEQERIARFLDERTARIDEIIAKKERLVELLKEKRTAFISRAITSASGERVKLSQCLDLNPSKRLAVGLEDAQEVSFVPMEALSDVGELSLQVRKCSDVRSGFTYFENGDVVLAKITPCFENGKAGVMRGLKNGFGFGTTEFVVMRPKQNMLSEYLYYVVYSDEFRQKGEVEMRGTAGQKRVSVTFLKNYQVNLPDLAQQRIIADTILEKMKRYQVTEKRLVDSVTVLQEFKSSLISHVVTGKIKV